MKKKILHLCFFIAGISTSYAQTVTPVAPDFGYADAGVIAVNHFLEINSASTGITLANLERFGSSIANLGDLDGTGAGVTTIAVGVPNAGAGGFMGLDPGEGAVYIINLNVDGTILGNVVEINNDHSKITLAKSDIFGASVANLGDLDIGLSSATDKTSSLVTIAVGAAGDSTGGVNKGALYLINLNSSGGIVGTPVKITSNTTGITISNSATFGASVANLGDLDIGLSGTNATNSLVTIAVGVIGDDTGGSNRGAIYIINLDSAGAVVGNEVKIDNDNSKITLANNNLFGTSVANLGDLDGATGGVTTIAVGTPGEGVRHGADGRGALYLINLNSSGGIVGTPVKITNDTTGITLANRDNFGRSIANLGDLDGRGAGAVTIAVGAAIGAKTHIINLNASGAIVENAGVINNTALNITTDDDDRFGSSIANIGDINGDGIDEIIIGESGEDTEGEGRGAIHIISFAKKQYSFTTADTADITLPAVEVGSPAPTYTLSPTTLPAGLSFDGTARTITGTPTAISAATEYTLTATIGSDTDTFVFSIDTSSAAVAANNAPTAITLDNLSVPENTTAVGNLSTTDLDGSDTHTYFLAAGTGDEDNGKFTIDNTADTIAFTTAPDFENPTDVGDTANNNTYAIRVQTDDSNGGTFAQTFIITVTDVTEAATFTIDAIAAASVSEGATYTSVTPSLSGDSPIGNVTYTKSGTDSDDFIIDANTGVVSFAPHDYENPEDADTSNDYEITITATDSDGNTASQNWTVSVTDYLELGGVAINPVLWVKANDGITENSSNVITGWTDRSPSSEVATPAGNPTLLSSLINFNPSVSFDGTNDHFEFSKANLIKNRDNFTFIAVAGSAPNTLALQHLLASDQDSGIRIVFRNGDVVLHRSGVGDIILDQDPPVESGDVGIVAVSRSGSNGNDFATYQDGAEFTKSDSNAGYTYGSTGTKTYLGRRGNGSERLDGQIAELVVFEDVLSEADLDKIQTHLAIKYGITLHSNVANYVNAAGTSVFDNSGAYVNDIFGIAKDDTSILDQRISKSKNGGVILTISTDATFTAVNSGHTDALTDGQYLVIGNDGGATTTQTTETPGTTTNRVIREWKVENTGSVGEVNLKFDGFDNTYTLYTDTDGDFSAGATEVGALNADGEIATTLADGTYFTLTAAAAANNAPTDITLTNATVDENQTVVGTLSTTDLDGSDTHTYSLVAGTGDEDNGKFTIDNTADSIAFTTVPDFENPTDAGDTANNNTYAIRVQTSDQDSETFAKAFIITVTNVNETVTFTIDAIADASVSEGVVYTSSTPSLSGDSPNGNVTYTKSGNDADDFTINASTGVVSMVARDYENPADADTSNDYEITITATDSDGNTASQNWTVSVTDYLELGGVAINPVLWVKANDGITENSSNVITGWTDRSPSSEVATPAGNPTLLSSLINFNPSVSFDGTNDHFEFSKANLIKNRDNFTFIAVAGSAPNTLALQHLLASDQDSGIRIVFRNGDVVLHRSGVGDIILDQDPPVESGDVGIVAVSRSGSNGNDFATYQDGAEFTKSDSNAGYTYGSTGTKTYLGRRGNGSERLDGQIAELVVFEDVLSEADLDKIQTHLAIKYGITLHSNVANYVNAAGTSVFDNSGAYVNDIFGIAKDDTSILDQRISKSKNGGVILTISTDATFTAVNSGHTDALTDGQYLVIGNDGGATTTQTTETPGTTTNRVIREWKVENTGSVGEVNLKFDGFDNTYTLYTDTDGDFSAGATEVGALNADGEIATTLADGTYFTLTAAAAANNAPTDITLTNATVDENQTVVGTLSTTDLDGSDTHTYSLVAGTGDEDNGKFTIDNTADSIAFTTVPDFENPTDAGDTANNNTYAIRVQTSDQDSETFAKAFIITVTNVNETVTFTIDAIADASVSEGVVYTSSTPSLSGDSPNGNVTYTKSGNDADDFTINASTGVVSMVARDYENPADADTSNDYEITITATDSDGNTASQSWTVSVTDYLELGGVELNPLLWVRADDGITETSNVITGWTDQSPSAESGTSAGDPVLSSNFRNFNPSVVFDGVDDAFEFNKEIIKGTDHFVLVAVTGSTYTTGGPLQHILGTDRSGGARVIFRDGDPALHITNTGDLVLSEDPPIGSGDIGIVAITRRGNVGENFAVYQDGDRHFGNWEPSSPINYASTTKTYLGRRNDTSERLTGEIAELIVYDGLFLEDVELNINKILTNLAIKYGITLHSEVPDYVKPDGTSVFANSGTYTNDIVGIAKDDTSVLDQRISKSKNSGAILTISTDATFTGVNSGHTGSLTDGQYLVIGNDGGATTTQATETPATTAGRITREWKVENTGSVGEVNLKFDGFDNTYTLYTDADGDFSTGATLAGALNANGEIAATFSNGVSYFTLIAEPPAVLGGVSTSPALWVKANDGITENASNVITGWTDQSVSAVAGTPAGSPVLSSSFINFNPTVLFDGTNDHFEFNKPSPITGRNNFTFIAVAGQNDISSTALQHVLGASNGNGVRIPLRSGDIALHRTNVGDLILDPDPPVASGDIGIVAVSRSGSDGNDFASYQDGAEFTKTVNNSASFENTARVYIGGGSGGNGRLNGQVAELVVFEDVLSEADLDKVQTHLAIKYGITLHSNVANYVNAAGTSVFANSGTYVSDIVGIAKDDTSVLDQRISKSKNSGVILTISTDATFTGVNSGHTGSLTDGQYLIIGNDGGATTTQATETPGATTSRITREWKVENTGSVGEVNLKFDGFDNTYTLYTDDDGDFSTGATLAGALNANGEIAATFSNGVSYFTLTTAPPNSTPTGITLTLANATVDENQTAVGTFSTTDADASDSHTYTLATGTGDEDNDKFTLDSATGVIAFTTAPDHENPTDAGDTAGDNTYAIRVQTDDGNGGTFEKEFIITVTDVDETTLNQISSITIDNRTVAEGTTRVGVLDTVDPNSNAHTYTLVPGSRDNNSFVISNVNVLSFKTAPDYESPTDTFVGNRQLAGDNKYLITIETENNFGHTRRTVITITVTATLKLSIKVFLQGPYNTNSKMNANLLTANNGANIIPTTSPYEDGATVLETVFDAEAEDDAIVDWVEVSLHDPDDVSTVISSTSALLQRDGDVVALDGSSALQITGTAGDYKVSINHRNHIPVITDVTQSLSATETAIDFTNDLTIVTGGSNAMAEVATGIYALFSGDVNQNGQVQVDDYNAVIQDVGRGGYLTSDVDMNGELQVSDINFVLKTLGKGKQF